MRLPTYHIYAVVSTNFTQCFHSMTWQSTQLYSGSHALSVWLRNLGESLKLCHLSANRSNSCWDVGRHVSCWLAWMPGVTVSQYWWLNTQHMLYAIYFERLGVQNTCEKVEQKNAWQTQHMLYFWKAGVQGFQQKCKRHGSPISWVINLDEVNWHEFQMLFLPCEDRQVIMLQYDKKIIR